MLAILELLSFHAAVFGAASILFFFLLLPVHFGGKANDLAVWILCSALVVVLFSKTTGAYRASCWARAKPHIASIFLAIGHLAPIASAYIYLLMLRAGTGSGVVFLPLIGWAIIFYSFGIVWVVSRLTSVNG